MNKVEKVIDRFSKGDFVILVDDPDRENEGDLILSADFVTAAHINFMLTKAKGMLHLAMNESGLNRLGLDLIPTKNANHNTPRFAMPFDALEGVSTGISAEDRATTICMAIDEKSTPEDIVVPGHIYPLAAHPEGLVGRRGHTEGSVALAMAAGLSPAVVMSEILTEDGRMASGKELDEFSDGLDIPIIDIKTLSKL